MPQHSASPSAVTLRRYRAGDWRAMYALDVLCFDPPFRFREREMRRLAEQQGAISLLAESGSELAGFCIVHREGHWGYVVTLDVAAAWRRHGVARRLMQEAELALHSGGATGMGLHVYTGNTGAICFYEGLGFSRAGIVEAFYGQGLDAIVYRKMW